MVLTSKLLKLIKRHFIKSSFNKFNVDVNSIFFGLLDPVLPKKKKII